MLPDQDWIEWIEPFGPDNEPVFCRVTVRTAVAAQKFSSAQAKEGFTYVSDEDALDDFMVVHWANHVSRESSI